MKATSGMTERCLRHVGLRLELRLELGPGWSVREETVRDAREFAGMHELAGRMVELMPKRFYRHSGVLRAFKALVLLPGHVLNGKEALVFSLTEGFGWDFEDNICPGWGLLFGRGEPQFPSKKSPERWPAIYKAGIISGYGVDLRKKPRRMAGLAVGAL